MHAHIDLTASNNSNNSDMNSRLRRELDNRRSMRLNNNNNSNNGSNNNHGGSFSLSSSMLQQRSVSAVAAPADGGFSPAQLRQHLLQRSPPFSQQQQQQQQSQNPPPAAAPLRSASENRTSLLRKQLHHQHSEVAAAGSPAIPAARVAPSTTAKETPKYFVVGLQPPHGQPTTFGPAPPAPVGTATQRLAMASTVNGKESKRLQLERSQQLLVEQSRNLEKLRASMARRPSSHLEQFAAGGSDANFFPPKLQQQQQKQHSPSPVSPPPPVVQLVDADAQERTRSHLWQLFQSCSRVSSIQQQQAVAPTGMVGAAAAVALGAASPVVVRQRRMSIEGFNTVLTELQRRRMCHPVSKDDAALLWRLASLNECHGGGNESAMSNSNNGSLLFLSSSSLSPENSCNPASGDPLLITISWTSFHRVLEQRVVVTDPALLAALKRLTGDDEYFAMLPDGAVPLTSQLMQPATAAKLEEKRSSSREPSRAKSEEQRQSICLIQPEPIIMSPEPEQRLTQQQQQQQQHNNTAVSTVSPSRSSRPGELSPSRKNSVDDQQLQLQRKRSLSPNIARGEPQLKLWNASHSRGDLNRVAQARQLYMDPSSLVMQQKLHAIVGAPASASASLRHPQHAVAAAAAASTASSTSAAGGMIFSIPHQSSPPSKSHRRRQPQDSEDAVTPRLASASSTSHHSATAAAASDAASKRRGDAPAPETQMFHSHRSGSASFSSSAIATAHHLHHPHHREGVSTSTTPRRSGSTSARSHSRLVERHLEEQQQQQVQLHQMIVQRALGSAIAPPPQSVDDMMSVRFNNNASHSNNHHQQHSPPPSSHIVTHVVGISKDLFFANKVAAARCPHRVAQPSAATLIHTEQKQHDLMLMQQRQEEAFFDNDADNHSNNNNMQHATPAQTNATIAAAGVASPMINVSPDTPAPDYSAIANTSDKQQQKSAVNTTTDQLPSCASSSFFDSSMRPEERQQQLLQQLPPPPLKLAADWRPCRMQATAKEFISKLQGREDPAQVQQAKLSEEAAEAERRRVKETAASDAALQAWQQKWAVPPPPPPSTRPATARSASPMSAQQKAPLAPGPLTSPSKPKTIEEKVAAANANGKHWRN